MSPRTKKRSPNASPTERPSSEQRAPSMLFMPSPYTPPLALCSGFGELPGMRSLRLGLSALALSWSCRQLPELEPNTCGNGVVEGGEDCDLFSQFGTTSRCGNTC